MGTIERARQMAEAGPGVRGPWPADLDAPAPASARTQSQDGRAVALGPQSEAAPRQAQIYRGRGRAGGDALYARQPSRTTERRVALNFENAEISEVASIVLGDILQVNYAVDPSVQGQIRLKSTEPVPVSTVLGILETSLRQNNAALVVDGELYRIVPANQALGLTSVPELVSARRPIPPGFSIRVVPLRYIAASQMVKILEPFVSETGLTRVDEARNLLVLAGTRPELQIWLETIETFDVDWFQDKSVGIFPLANASAEVVVKELERIFGVSPGESQGALEFLPIERLNAVMAIALDPSYLDRTNSWVKRLDAGSRAGRRLFVYRMKHAKAIELAPLLARLFNPNAAFDPFFAPPPAGGAPVAPGLAPQVIGSAGLPSLELNTQTVTSAPVTSSNQMVAALNPAPAPAPAPFGPPVIPAAGGDGIQIVANVASNALIIKATATEYQAVLDALRELDVPPLQVLVEATIAEVTITDELRYGVQYFLEAEDFFGEMVTATLSNGAPAADAVEQIFSTFPGFSVVTGTPARVILDALDAVTTVNVISSPNLMVLDNQTANLVVGDEVPVLQQEAQIDEVLRRTVERRNTGVIFQVTPRINLGGSVTLDIVQEVSSVRQSATTSDTLTPTISQRRIESSVVSESGETVVLGGLFSEEVSSGRSGIPFLSRMPLIGWLFGSTTERTEQTELLVLISPRVVKSQAEVRTVTREMRNRVRDLDLLYR